MSQQPAASEHLIGLDLIKLLSFCAIAVFHSSLLYFYSPTIPFREISPIFRAVETYTRALAFSGFTIVLLSSLLLAYSSELKKRKARLFAVLGLGALILSSLMSEGAWIRWDVYSLFLFGLASFILIRSQSRALGILGFLLLWIPFWKFDSLRSYLGAEAQQVFGLAPCSGREITEWPLLPWIGLVWFGSWLGHEARRIMLEKRSDKFDMSWKEGGVWAIFLGASLPQWGAFYNIGIGPLFSCDAYRQEPSVFWSHMVWVIFAIRLSFDRRIQRFLVRQPWSDALSRLAISQHFWLAYLVQYVHISLLVFGLQLLRSGFPEFYEEIELPLLEFLILTVVFQFEFITRQLYAWGVRLAPQIRRLTKRVDGVAIEKSQV